MTIVSVYAVFADETEARAIARAVVEKRLAACANILPPIHSIYHWDGEVRESGEVAALFKTTAAQAGRLIERIADLHSYDVPCIVSSPVDKVLADYANWVETTVRN